ncbi:hypothetical protein M9H77_03828 [Catharanthus roseus]|uniref:Uncharacterized protein n=1 Tax=Catharanthus roseus TaxID=4058 RepID=A0ACC0CCI0_CATRO|nr:hypothetical protein M9H77_03828 [Catharanthus roseus]
MIGVAHLASLYFSEWHSREELGENPSILLLDTFQTAELGLQITNEWFTIESFEEFKKCITHYAEIICTNRGDGLVIDEPGKLSQEAEILLEPPQAFELEAEALPHQPGEEGHDLQFQTGLRYKNCKRRILGKKMHNNTDFEIWSMNSKRSCGRNLNQKLVIASLLAVRYSDDFKSERDVDVQEFIAKVRRDLLVDISPSKDYGAKLEALEIIEGRKHHQHATLHSDKFAVDTKFEDMLLAKVAGIPCILTLHWEL